MSAFIVHPGHIDYIVSAAIALNIGYPIVTFNGARVDLGNADDVGRMLYRENHRSVAYRYQDSRNEGLPGPIPIPDPDAYVYQQHRNLTAAQVVKALACYEYQTCETPDWPTTDAHRFCVQVLAGITRTMPGYEEAEWEITERGQDAWGLAPSVDWEGA